jgi:hypothetical protein
MSDDSSSLLTALAKVDCLRHAAANAAPAIEELLRAGLSLELTESEAYRAIEIPKGVAIWCRKVQRQGMAPAVIPGPGPAAGGGENRQQGRQAAKGRNRHTTRGS